MPKGPLINISKVKMNAYYNYLAESPVHKIVPDSLRECCGLNPNCPQ